MTDLTQFGTLLAETGVPFVVKDLRTGRAIKNDDGSPMTITLLGRTSEAFTETARDCQLARAKYVSDGNQVDADYTFGEDTRILCACCTDWNIDEFGGLKPFPWSAANARRLFNDKNMRWLNRQALDFVMSDANFLPAGSKISSDSPDTSFASASPQETAVQ
jgi:hypothetical protein